MPSNGIRNKYLPVAIERHSPGEIQIVAIPEIVGIPYPPAIMRGHTTVVQCASPKKWRCALDSENCVPARKSRTVGFSMADVDDFSFASHGKAARIDRPTLRV